MNDPTVFKKNCSHLGKPLLDLFTLTATTARYIACQPDSQCVTCEIGISMWKRVSRCHRNQTDPFSNHLREVMDFLADLFELRFEYSAINTHKSAISAFHEPTEGFLWENTHKVWSWWQVFIIRGLRSLDIALFGILKQSWDI